MLIGQFILEVTFPLKKTGTFAVSNDRPFPMKVVLKFTHRGKASQTGSMRAGQFSLSYLWQSTIKPNPYANSDIWYRMMKLTKLF